MSEIFQINIKSIVGSINLYVLLFTYNFFSYLEVLKKIKIVSETERTKIVEKTDSYIHAEAKTKWRRYTDDLLIKTIPEKGIIQVRSESRVGIGDNGVNQKRVDDFAYRLMTEPDITS